MDTADCCIGNTHQKLWLLKTFYLAFNLVIKLIVANNVDARKYESDYNTVYKFVVQLLFSVAPSNAWCSAIVCLVIHIVWWINFIVSSIWRWKFCMFESQKKWIWSQQRNSSSIYQIQKIAHLPSLRLSCTDAIYTSSHIILLALLMKMPFVCGINVIKCGRWKLWLCEAKATKRSKDKNTW